MTRILLILYILGSFIFAHGNVLTVDFKGMTPHVGQILSIRVVDVFSNREVARKVQAVTGADFMVFLDGLADGHDYRIDFFSDHNGNGRYDDPPSDHTWRLELNDVAGDTILSFTHNTSFTALDWQNAVTVNISSLTPHVGQQLEMRLVDKKTLLEIYRDSLTAVESSDFSMVLPGIEEGESYYIDFYADHNGNKIYDAPPADHAWRLELEKPEGDTTLSFSHNTNFTDIQWPYALSLQLFGMSPHVGQLFWVRAIDLLTGEEAGRTEVLSIPQADFEVSVIGARASGKYRLEFFADHNGNGLYNAPPTDHAWALESETTNGGAVVQFQHNTNFSMLDWNYRLFLEMKNMSPHMGQTIQARVTEQASGKEAGRVKLGAIYDSEFTLVIPGIQLATDYYVDFFADHNGNGVYDGPPADHAWREEYNAGDDGDNDISFEHNTNFTDIAWRYNFTLDLKNMSPHLGQYFEVRLVNTDNSELVGVKSSQAIPAADFSLSVGGLQPGNTYNVDFYSDHNGNGQYDAPPADHAWRATFVAAQKDTVVPFVHNTNFTDIGMVTGLKDTPATAAKFQLYNNYPNPFNPVTTLSFELPENAFVSLIIYNINGQKVRSLVVNDLAAGKHSYVWNGLADNGQPVSSGVYFYHLQSREYNQVKQMTLIK